MDWQRGRSMVRELDTVVLVHDLAAYGLERGDIGAIVHCYEGNRAFEVEFVTGAGETVALLTLSCDDVRPIGNREILRVRELVLA
jgi:hypothetical protein